MEGKYKRGVLHMGVNLFSFHCKWTLRGKCLQHESSSNFSNPHSFFWGQESHSFHSWHWLFVVSMLPPALQTIWQNQLTSFSKVHTSPPCSSHCPSAWGHRHRRFLSLFPSFSFLSGDALRGIVSFLPQPLDLSVLSFPFFTPLPACFVFYLCL